ncbi:MAG TPA: AzlC family ABC transporter permease, partial [Candidatus Deferrimicrobium sp.]|nr:AzlC family ABC transporter permease [Candidatus Deferrimicrobium sp.]
MPDGRLPGPPPRRRLRARQARALRRLRRHLREDLPALTARRVPDPHDADALRGARRQLVLDGLGIIVSAAGFGFVYGLTARTTGHFSPVEAMAMSLFAFAGAAQFTAIGYVAAGLSWPAIGLLTFLLNARHILYSAALAPWFRARSFVERAVAAHLLTDEAFALSIAHFRRVGRFDAFGYWYAAIVTTLIPWNVATFAGVMLGDAIVEPTRLGIDVISPAAMGGLAVGLISGRRELVAALAGAAIGVAASLVANPTVGIIAGGVLGPLAGLLVPPAAAHEAAPIGTPASAGRYGMPGTPADAP